MGDYLARWKEQRDKRGPLALRWVVTYMNISEFQAYGCAIMRWMHGATPWQYKASRSAYTLSFMVLGFEYHDTELARSQ